MNLSEKILEKKVDKKPEKKIDEKVKPQFFDDAGGLSEVMRKYKPQNSNMVSIKDQLREILGGLEEVDESGALEACDDLKAMIKKMKIEQ